MSLDLDSTSEAATLLSSVHGRDRRHQRGITKKDLQAAIKYGTKEAQPNQRWKYTFANIVYITNQSSRREITSYVQPVKVQKVPLPPDAVQQHAQLQAKLLDEPNLATSHTVVVVDMSGSMREEDVELFRSRCDAVYATVALDLVGKHLDDGKCISGTEMLTLIEMRDEATTVIFREPITNVLFNRLVTRKKKARPFLHGNYLPALQAVTDAMELDEGASAALSVVFLSDGRPSDPRSPLTLSDEINQCVQGWCDKFGGRLHVNTIGFGGPFVDFTVLNNMAAVATASGSLGTFTNPHLCPFGLSSTLTDLRASLSATQTSLMTTGLDNLSRATRVLRPVEKEAQFMVLTSKTLSDGKWDVHTTSVERFQLNDHLTRFHGLHNWANVPLTEGTTGGGIRLNVFGEGAERVVYQFCEVQGQAPGMVTVVPPMMVAKYSRYTMGMEEEMHFHEVFCRTQRKAGKFARWFNEVVAKKAKNVARIEFLECFVYALDGLSVLVEKMLPQAEYKKWNGNNGFVLGKTRAKAPDVQKLLQSLDNSSHGATAKKSNLERIEEEDDDDDDDDSSNGGLSDDDEDIENTAASPDQPVVSIANEDVPQAFSHFTYHKSRRKTLVCDLQGVLNTVTSPPVFELTDPVIHYKGRGKGFKYGRTDHGIAGIHRFFQTHECNPLCDLLNLPKCTRANHR